MMEELRPGRRVVRWTLLSEANPHSSKVGGSVGGGSADAHAAPRSWCSNRAFDWLCVPKPAVAGAVVVSATERSLRHGHNRCAGPPPNTQPGSRPRSVASILGTRPTVGLRASWDSDVPRVGSKLRGLPARHGSEVASHLQPRPHRSRRRLRAWQLPVGFAFRAGTQQAQRQMVRFRGEHLILAEVAARLGITRNAARALERRGALPARRVVGFTPAETAEVGSVLIDLNDVPPLGWPPSDDLAAVASEMACGEVGAS